MKLIVHSMALGGGAAMVLTLRSADGTTLPGYTAGAHLDLHLPSASGRTIIRQYSLMSPPDDAPTEYVVAVALDANSRGGSRAVHEQLRVGQEVEVSEPRNHFELEPDGRSLLMAGGIGATPLAAMAAQLEGQEREYELHTYAASASKAVLGEYLDGYKTTLHLTDVDGSLRAATALPWEYQDGDHLYICGPSGFIAKVEELAEAAGFPTETVRSEKFTVDEPVDITGDSFTVIAASTGEALQVGEDDTIADVLMNNGYHVELSCEQGICGSCILGVLEGTPDHRDEVQTDAEHEANDQINVCCSRSKTASMTLDI